MINLLPKPVFDNSVPISFIEKLKVEKDCIIWTGATSRGYGRYLFKDSVQQVHRVSYILFIDPFLKIQDDIHHICYNTLCIKPEHLKAISASKHRYLEHGNGHSEKTMCPKGHPYNEENTYKYTYYYEGRSCRECHRLSSKKWRDKKRQLK